MKKFFLPLIILTAILFCGCGNEFKQINSLEDAKNARLGTWPACGYEFCARKHLPDAEYVYLDFISDLVQNLQQHKIDAFIIGKVYVENLKREGVAVDYLPQYLGKIPLSYICSKNERGQKLCKQLNEFIAKENSDGELDALQKKWFFGDETNRTFKKSELSGENGKLIFSTDGLSEPFVYLRENQVVGYEIEILDKFCAAYGYDYEIKISLFKTMLIDVSTGKVDLGVNAIEKMPEREQNMLFTEPTYIEDAVIVVNSNSVGNENFFTAAKNRITASLIVEDRWKMLVEGASTTLTITIAAIIFGTLLGFAMYMIYREGNRIIKKIIDAIYDTLQGIPTMVLLLFFYYTVFSSINVSAIFVAVTVFAIVLSISIFVILKSGEQSISRGQTEAALSLGFSERRTFIKFILPQIILNHFQPYRLVLNTILLETAIVGYIAVLDLTKMADLIRGRTYDGFVPIISIAVVYLFLSRLLLILTDYIGKKINPKNRSRDKILKGVKL